MSPDVVNPLYVAQSLVLLSHMMLNRSIRTRIARNNLHQNCAIAPMKSRIAQNQRTRAFDFTNLLIHRMKCAALPAQPDERLLKRWTG
jgi:hypothetical protein